MGVLCRKSWVILTRKSKPKMELRIEFHHEIEKNRESILLCNGESDCFLVNGWWVSTPTHDIPVIAYLDFWTFPGAALDNFGFQRWIFPDLWRFLRRRLGRQTFGECEDVGICWDMVYEGQTKECTVHCTMFSEGRFFGISIVEIPMEWLIWYGPLTWAEFPTGPQVPGQSIWALRVFLTGFPEMGYTMEKIPIYKWMI